MSRTYRYYESYYSKANGILYSCDEFIKIQKIEKELYGVSGWRPSELPSSGWKGVHIFEKQRDRKPWNKPPKWYKQMHRRIERAQVKNAMRNDKEIPFFKKYDQWNWT